MSTLYKSAAGEALVLARYRDYLQGWPVANEQRVIATQEGETFVLSCGNPAAPPLLLLHGAMGNSVAWIFDAVVWAQHFRVHVVDVIGEAGLSAQVRPAFTGDRYVTWLGEVAAALQLTRFSLVGESLGGWLALAFASAHPQRIKQLVLLCPAGVGTQKNFLARVWPLLLLGPWGLRKVREMALGKQPKIQELPPAVGRFLDFMTLVHRHFRPRQVQFPLFTDAALSRLTMPLLAIAGGKDVFFDGAQIAQRLQSLCSQAEVVFRPEAGHLLKDRTQPILAFLLRSQTNNNPARVALSS
jgi:pimeloyl-ACP methyl ester carboxylesterase